jgi:hypothetical protein
LDNWDGHLILKSDFEDTGFTGPGEYKLKAGYYHYTSGGKLSSVNWSENDLTVNIFTPLPTSTPSPTASPTITPTQAPPKTPSPSPVVKTSTPHPVKTVVHKSPSPDPTSAVLSVATETAVVEITGKPDNLPTAKTRFSKEAKIKLTSYLFIAAGILLNVFGVTWLLSSSKTQKNNNDI